MQHSSFTAPRWLRNPHLQTIWAGLLRRRRSLPSLQQQRLELADGDFVDLCLTTDNGGPVILVLHGLQGSIRSRYAAGICQALSNAGFVAALMHFRSCSGEVNRLSRLYHSGETGDAREVLHWLGEQFPQRKTGAVGFSLGGNVLLKLLGENLPPLPAAAVAVSVPMRLDYCATRMNRGFSKFYQWQLLRSMKRTALAKHRLGQLTHIDMKKVMRAKTFWDIDEHLTAPLHGFRSAAEYYALCSSRQFLQHINIPTLIIHAEDAPFTSREVLPEPGELSGSIKLEVSRHGGHVGFVGGTSPWQTFHYLEQRIPAFLAEHLRG